MRKYNTIITEDLLKSLSDDNLRRLFLETRSKINKGRRKKEKTKSDEIDYCYIQQELHVRNQYKKMARKQYRK